MSITERQQQVEEFVNQHDLEGTIEFKIMDLVSEVGEVVKDATKSSNYGMEKECLDVKEDEIGDVFFSLFMVCNDLNIDAEEALDTALKKYERRLEDKGDPGSR